MSRRVDLRGLDLPKRHPVFGGPEVAHFGWHPVDRGPLGTTQFHPDRSRAGGAAPLRSSLRTL